MQKQLTVCVLAWHGIDVRLKYSSIDRTGRWLAV